jgi:hypothetical protein
MGIEERIIKRCLENKALFAVKKDYGKYICSVARYAKGKCEYYHEEYKIYMLRDKVFIHTYKFCRYHDRKRS